MGRQPGWWFKVKSVTRELAEWSKRHCRACCTICFMSCISITYSFLLENGHSVYCKPKALLIKHLRWGLCVITQLTLHSVNMPFYSLREAGEKNPPVQCVIECLNCSLFINLPGRGWETVWEVESKLSSWHLFIFSVSAFPRKKARTLPRDHTSLALEGLPCNIYNHKYVVLTSSAALIITRVTALHTDWKLQNFHGCRRI